MARKNISKVIEAFKAGRSAKGDSKATCSTDGNEIYSYAMKIAERLPDGSIWIEEYSKAPSATTRSHIRACQFLLRAEPLVVVAEERAAELRKEEREATVAVGGIRLRAVG
jgi:hypothetical protein